MKGLRIHKLTTPAPRVHPLAGVHWPAAGHITHTKGDTNKKTRQLSKIRTRHERFRTIPVPIPAPPVLSIRLHGQVRATDMVFLRLPQKTHKKHQALQPCRSAKRLRLRPVRRPNKQIKNPQINLMNRGQKCITCL